MIVSSQVRLYLKAIYLDVLFKINKYINKRNLLVSIIDQRIDESPRSSPPRQIKVIFGSLKKSFI